MQDLDTLDRSLENMRSMVEEAAENDIKSGSAASSMVVVVVVVVVVVGGVCSIM
jgi:hypothetical protein